LGNNICYVLAMNSETTELNDSPLARLLAPVGQGLSLDLAKELASWRADDEVQARIETLADKCTEGELTEDERVEYETYVNALDVLGAIQAKARRVLKENSIS
jgi:hypothetical protein